VENLVLGREEGEKGCQGHGEDWEEVGYSIFVRENGMQEEMWEMKGYEEAVMGGSEAVERVKAAKCGEVQSLDEVQNANPPPPITSRARTSWQLRNQFVQVS
jgi:hypothetical protein